MNARTRSLTYDYCKNERKRKMGVEAIAECVLNCTHGTNYIVVVSPHRWCRVSVCVGENEQA